MAGEAFLQQQADSLRAQLDRLSEREKWIVGALLAEGEGTLLGKRVRFRVEWLDGLPFGMDEDAVREFGRRMLPEAAPDGTR